MSTATPLPTFSPTDALAAFCKAAGEPLRLNILRALSNDSFGVLELAHIFATGQSGISHRSEEHTSELQSRPHLVCRLLLEKKKRLPLKPPANPDAEPATANRRAAERRRHALLSFLPVMVPPLLDYARRHFRWSPPSFPLAS